MTNEHSLPDPCGPDPLVGEEIIRVSLESLGVLIHTNRSQIQIVSEFLVRRTGHGDCRIVPQSKTGDVSALWPSVGSRIEAVIWGQDLVLRMDDGVEIIVPPSSSGYRGTIFSSDGMGMAVEEF